MPIFNWQSLLNNSALTGWISGDPCFKRDGETITGEDGGWGDRLMTGDPNWCDYELSAAVTVLKGEMAQLHYRIAEGDRCWYTLDLRMQDKVVALGVADNRPGGPGLTTLVSMPFSLEYNKPYALRVVCNGPLAKGYIDECPIGQIKDMKYLSGPIGLGLWRCKAAFHAPRIKLTVN